VQWIPGHWIAAGILEKHLYPELIRHTGWQAHAWNQALKRLLDFGLDAK
jgi:hypothetical protein